MPTFAFAQSVECQCVLYLREIMGVNIHGNADTINPNVPDNYVNTGDVILFDYPHGYHVAAVQKVWMTGETTYIQIAESNFHTCTPDVRTILMTDPAVRGVFRPLSTAGQF